MTAVSKADYLQKYISGVDQTSKSNKKKRRKVKKNLHGYKVIDDDVDVKGALITSAELSDHERSDDGDDDTPIVVSVNDDSNQMVKLDPRQWTVIGSTTSDEKQNLDNSKAQGSRRRHDSSGSDSTSKVGSSQKHRRSKQLHDLGENRVPRRAHDDARNQQSQGGYISDEDKLGPHKSRRRNKETEQSSPCARKSNHLEDEHSPRRGKGRRDDSGSDLSPVRAGRTRHDSESDLSPVRAGRTRHDSESDQSPSRSGKIHSKIDKLLKSTERNPIESGSDQSPQRVRREHDTESDQSPPRANKKRHDSGSDQSPPRARRKRHNSDSDQSPPRTRNIHSKIDESLQTTGRKPVEARSSHTKPHLKKEQIGSESDQSPPRAVKRRHDSGSDQSPPRERRKRNEVESNRSLSPSRRKRNDSESDQSPPRERGKNKDSRNGQALHRAEREKKYVAKEPRSHKEERGSRCVEPPSQTARRLHESGSDQSPRSVQKERHNKDRYSRDSARGDVKRDERSDRSPSRSTKTSRHDTPRQREKELARPEKTLSGLKAGLQSAKVLRTEVGKAKVQENRQLNKIDDSVLGKGARTVFRDRSTGKLRDLKEESHQEELKKAKENEIKAKYKEWGQGLKQQEDRLKQFQEERHEMTKPLARYEGDEDLEKHLREQERVGDPMLQFLQKKKEVGKPKFPMYQGPPPPPNRFSIKPGYRWDGVDRSNGFEQKLFERQSNKVARDEEAYKWSTENM